MLCACELTPCCTSRSSCPSSRTSPGRARSCHRAHTLGTEPFARASAPRRPALRARLTRSDASFSRSNRHGFGPMQMKHGPAAAASPPRVRIGTLEAQLDPFGRIGGEGPPPHGHSSTFWILYPDTVSGYCIRHLHAILEVKQTRTRPVKMSPSKSVQNRSKVAPASHSRGTTLSGALL